MSRTYRKAPHWAKNEPQDPHVCGKSNSNRARMTVRETYVRGLVQHLTRDVREQDNLHREIARRDDRRYDRFNA